MRKTKRFTPQVINRFRKNKRGEGIFANYQGWHQVTRGDPSSLGLSHILDLNGRQVDLLSIGELVCIYFSCMMKEVVDMREQFPLSLNPNNCELNEYDYRIFEEYPGTIQLAKELGVKHPVVRGEGKSEHWVMTTDLLLTLRIKNRYELLAISTKPSKNLTKRDIQLQTIEREYWVRRNVEWLLFTPSEYDKRVSLRLRDTAPWAQGVPSSKNEINIAKKISFEMQGLPLLSVLEAISIKLGTLDAAQRAFWQGVWNGHIFLDLRRGWRPHEAILLLTAQQFEELNPIASRRSSSWN